MSNPNIHDDDKPEKQADPFYSAENQHRSLVSKERMEKNGGTVHELIEENDELTIDKLKK